jgi:hypothetical protein
MGGQGAAQMDTQFAIGDPGFALENARLGPIDPVVWLKKEPAVGIHQLGQGGTHTGGGANQ